MSQGFEEGVVDGVTEKYKFWQPYIEALEHSGISQSEYCRDKGLSIKRFGYWKRKLCSKNPEAVNFVPVSIKRLYPVSVNAGASLRLVISNDYTIDLGDGQQDRVPYCMDTKVSMPYGEAKCHAFRRGYLRSQGDFLGLLGGLTGHQRRGWVNFSCHEHVLLVYPLKRGLNTLFPGTLL